jgi:hypothetical protein
LQAEHSQRETKIAAKERKKRATNYIRHLPVHRPGNVNPIITSDDQAALK